MIWSGAACIRSPKDRWSAVHNGWSTVDRDQLSWSARFEIDQKCLNSNNVHVSIMWVLFSEFWGTYLSVRNGCTKQVPSGVCRCQNSDQGPYAEVVHGGQHHHNHGHRTKHCSPCSLRQVGIQVVCITATSQWKFANLIIVLITSCLLETQLARSLQQIAKDEHKQLTSTRCSSTHLWCTWTSKLTSCY
jgi:hypothetical protein